MVLALTTKKYSSLRNFIFNCTARNEEFNLSLVCKAVSLQNSEVLIDNSCFYCNYCYFGDLLSAYSIKFDEIKHDYPSSVFFNKQLVKLPNSRIFLDNPNNKNLYTFTSIEETKRIQLWAVSILSNFTNQKVMTAMEIPVYIESFDRTGRIYIGARSGDKYVFIETKTTLRDLMKDERFVEQYLNYLSSISNVLTSNKFILFVLIGGSEAELYPPDSENNLEDIGELSERFYKLIANNGSRIPFVSVAAFWALSIKFMENKNFNIIAFLNDLFKIDNVYGLVSGGIIVKGPAGFQVNTIPHL